MPLQESTKFTAIAKKLSRSKAAPRTLLFAADVGALDARAAKLGSSGQTLMESAGRAVATQRFSLDIDARGPVLILAGPGKNGGDGYVAATALAAEGETVLLLETEAARRPDDAEAARGAWLASGGEVAALSPDNLAAALAQEPVVVIDALFGVGLTRALSGPPADAAAQLADARRRRGGLPVVIAVDMPSGVSADTGVAPGPAMEADVTITFVARKPGQFLADGAGLCGAVVVADIGMPAAAWDAISPTAFEIAPGLWPRSFDKSSDGHKYAHGAALIASGGFGASGAARLAAEAALRIGAGLVTVLAPTGAMTECAAQLTSVMLREAETVDALARHLEDPRVSALALGMGHGAHPGGAERTRAFVRTALHDASRRLTVLDADALTAFEAEPEALFAAIAKQPVVLTPHHGEFARLFPDEAEKLKSDEGYGKLKATSDAATRSGAVVLFKGPDTVVAAPDGRAGLQAATGARAAPWLATAGSGDVLAGMIAGLGARGFSSFDAACAGAWAHLEAGRVAGPGSIAEDLPAALRSVLTAETGAAASGGDA